jgi:CDP-paratose 2-epimerase
VLYVEDLLNSYDAAILHIDQAAGRVYNIGGGRKFTLSIWKQFGPMLEELLGKKIEVAYDEWRPGDQLVYVSDIRKAQKELKWIPRMDVELGVRTLFDWVSENKKLFA